MFILANRTHVAEIGKMNKYFLFFSLQSTSRVPTKTQDVIISYVCLFPTMNRVFLSRQLNWSFCNIIILFRSFFSTTNYERIELFRGPYDCRLGSDDATLGGYSGRMFNADDWRLYNVHFTCNCYLDLLNGIQINWKVYFYIYNFTVF